MVISMPTDSSFPFTYTFDKPLIMHTHGSIKAIAEPKVSDGKSLSAPNTIEGAVEIHALVSWKVQAQVGFLFPANSRMYIAGVEKELQLNAAIKAKLEVDTETKHITAEIEPIHREQKQRILHYASQTYTSVHNTLHIHVPEHHVHYDEKHMREKTFGKESSLEVNLLYQPNQNHLSTIWLKEQYHKYGLQGLILAPVYNPAIEHTRADIHFVGKQAPTQKIRILATYLHDINSEKGDVEPQISKFHEIAQLPQKERIKKFAQLASFEIETPEVGSYDAQVELIGSDTSKYTVIAAYARSNAHEKSRAISYVERRPTSSRDHPYEIALIINNTIPNTNAFNFDYALNLNSSVKSEIHLSCGESFETSTKVQVAVHISESEARRDHLQQADLLRVCREEEKHGNEYLPACLNLTISANLLDHIEMDIHYDNLGLNVEKNISRIHHILSYIGSDYHSYENSDGHNEEDRVKLNVEFDLDLEHLNITLQTETNETQYAEIPVNDLLKQIIIVHPVFHVFSRLSGYALNEQAYRRKHI